MWPFDIEERRKRRNAMADAALDRKVKERIGPALQEARTQAVQGARREILSRLAWVPIRVKDILLTWHWNAVDRLHSGVRSWYETRAAHLVRWLEDRRAEQEKNLMALDPAGIIQSVADQYRRHLIERVAQAGSVNLTQRSSEHAAKFVEALEQRAQSLRGSIGTGETPLPAGTRFYFENASGAKAYVVEQAPGMRTISYRGRKYRLAMPFVVFLVFLHRTGDFRSIHVSFRNSRLERFGDELYRPALPNIESYDGAVCLPYPYTSDHPAAVVENAIQNFWGSDFNNDGRNNWLDTGTRHDQVKDFGRWERESEKDPGFVLKLDWLTWADPDGQSIKAIVNRILGQERFETVSSVQELMASVASQAAEATREMLVAELPRFRFEESAAAAIREKALVLWGDNIAALQDSFRKAADEIFSELPAPVSVERDAEELQRLLLREAERQLEWVGITPAPQLEEAKENAA